MFSCCFNFPVSSVLVNMESCLVFLSISAIISQITLCYCAPFLCKGILKQFIYHMGGSLMRIITFLM